MRGALWGSVCLPFRSYDFSVSKDLRGFVLGDTNERTIPAFNIAIAAPFLATDELSINYSGIGGSHESEDDHWWDGKGKTPIRW